MWPSVLVEARSYPVAKSSIPRGAQAAARRDHTPAGTHADRLGTAGISGPVASAARRRLLRQARSERQELSSSAAPPRNVSALSTCLAPEFSPGFLSAIDTQSLLTPILPGVFLRRALFRRSFCHGLSPGNVSSSNDASLAWIASSIFARRSGRFLRRYDTWVMTAFSLVKSSSSSRLATFL